MHTAIHATHDNHPLLVRIWWGEQTKASVPILHGMAEHRERYNDLAVFLRSHGYEVIAHNHRAMAIAHLLVDILKLMIGIRFYWTSISLITRLNTLLSTNLGQMFKPKRTHYDWLSEDNAEIDQYTADLFAEICILYNIGSIY